MRVRAIAALATAVVLAGCVPFPYGAYYRPAYPDPSAVVTQASCGGQAGPPARLAFQAQPGLRVSANAMRGALDRREDRPFEMSVVVPQGHTLRFTADTIDIASPDAPRGRAVTPEARVYVSVRLPATEWIDAARLAPVDPVLRRASGTPVAAVRFGLGPLWVPGDVLDVQLPAIETETGRVALPPLRLEADTVRSHIRTYRTREHLQAVVDREAACRRDTPQQRCENIRLYDADSFRLTQGDFTFVGRFWAMQSSARGLEPLQLELQVEARGTGRWRFAEDVVGVSDAGTPRSQRFAQVGASFAAEVPLSAPVRGVAAYQARETTFSVSASLGTEERSRYTVRFPPYIVDGERYELKPIELERRSFDVGLEPFNC